MVWHSANAQGQQRKPARPYMPQRSKSEIGHFVTLPRASPHIQRVTKPHDLLYSSLRPAPPVNCGPPDLCQRDAVKHHQRNAAAAQDFTLTQGWTNAVGRKSKHWHSKMDGEQDERQSMQPLSQFTMTRAWQNIEDQCPTKKKWILPRRSPFVQARRHPRVPMHMSGVENETRFDASSVSAPDWVGLRHAPSGPGRWMAQ